MIRYLDSYSPNLDLLERRGHAQHQILWRCIRPCDSPVLGHHANRAAHLGGSPAGERGCRLNRPDTSGRYSRVRRHLPASDRRSRSAVMFKPVPAFPGSLASNVKAMLWRALRLTALIAAPLTLSPTQVAAQH